MLDKQELRDIYQHARDIVATRWTKGSITQEIDGKACHCALGALAVAAGVIPDDGTWRTTQHVANRVPVEVVDPLRAHGIPAYFTPDPEDFYDIDPEVGIVFAYNDDDETEQEDVVAAFDRALEALAA